VRKSVGCRLLKFRVERFPFGKKGREVHALGLVDGAVVIVVERVDDVDERVVVIVIKWVNNGDGVSIIKLTGRDFM